MRTLAQKPKARQHIPLTHSIDHGQAIVEPGDDVRAMLDLQQTIENQSVRPLLHVKNEAPKANSVAHPLYTATRNFSGKKP